MKSKSRDYSQLLIIAALLVTLPRFAGAFIAADMTTIPGWVSTALSIGMGISGLGMGILDVLGVAYVFDGWRRAMPGNGKPWPFRYKILTGFVLALFVVGIGILAPFTVSRMRGATMAVTLPDGWAWAWGMLVIASPYLLIGGIVTGQTGVVNINREPDKAPAEEQKSAESPGGTPEEAPVLWRDIQPHERYAIAEMTTKEIMDAYDIDDRKAREWRQKARSNGHAQAGKG